MLKEFKKWLWIQVQISSPYLGGDVKLTILTHCLNCLWVFLQDYVQCSVPGFFPALRVTFASFPSRWVGDVRTDMFSNWGSLGSFFFFFGLVFLSDKNTTCCITQIFLVVSKTLLDPLLFFPIQSDWMTYDTKL